MQNVYYLQKLKEEFSRRKRANSVYSLRAYGRDLGIHPSTLSQVISGKRSLPVKTVKRVTEGLRLRATERTLFVESVSRRSTTLDRIRISNSDDRFILDETYFQIIAEWGVFKRGFYSV